MVSIMRQPGQAMRGLVLATLLGALWLALAAQSSKPLTAPIPVANAAQTSQPSQARPRLILISGTLEAIDSQPVLVPASNFSPVNLRNFVAEGEWVKTGDLILRVDARSSSDLSQLEVEMAQIREKSLREAADLDVKALEVERQLVQARAELGKARLDAALPKGQISSLDYDRYQGQLAHAVHDLEVKQKAFDTAKDNGQRRRADGELEFKKAQINYAFVKTGMNLAEVRAKQDGYVVHEYGGRRGERYDEGGLAQPGVKVAQVMGNGPLKVVAYALEADRIGLREGQSVQLLFDALPGKRLSGSIKSIANAPEERQQWGSGRYFRIEADLPTRHGLPLVHGMSVLLDASVASGAPSGPVAGAPAAAAQPALQTAEQPLAGQKQAVNQTVKQAVTLEGEIMSHQTVAISPPGIPDVWQYNLVMLAPEGNNLKAGQTIARFEVKEVTNRLDTHRSNQKEKQRALEKLLLDQAEAARVADLALAEANSNLEKARRKADVPVAAVARVDFAKRIIERDLAEQLVKLSERQREAQARSRKAELNGLRSEIAQLQNQIDSLNQGLAGLEVKAVRDGVVLHRTGFNGDKLAVGSQVWRGLSVATLADPDRLFVLARLPEAQSNAAFVGQRAKVSLSGGNQELLATVKQLGRVYHGKSSNQANVVRDLTLELDGAPKGLRPGAAVQVKLLSSANKE